ncbi:MAG: macro domain-containing protein [bacterium]
MIHKIEGDILLTGAQVIAHGVAANDPMNQGLAQSLHKQYPAMHKDYHHWCHIQHRKPGEAWMWGGVAGIRLVNLITQEGGYKRGSPPGKATTVHVNHALRSLKKMIQKEKFSSIALPRLATGVGGLDWEDVEPLIETQLGDAGIPVFVYTRYTPGKKANESV